MGNKSIKKETKKPKKSAKSPAVSLSSSTPRPITVQPVLIKKERKPK